MEKSNMFCGSFATNRLFAGCHHHLYHPPQGFLLPSQIRRSMAQVRLWDIETKMLDGREIFRV